MKNARSISPFMMLMAALLLVGGGCAAGTQTDVNVDTDADAAMQGQTEDDAMMEGDGAMDADAGMEADGAMEVDGDAMMDDGDAGADLDVEVAADAKVFEVSGANFEFDMKEIRVQQGDTVTINFTAASGLHDWMVEEFDAATAQVRDGGSSSVTFVADQKGEFEYYCSVGRHRQMGMVGTLIVE